MSVRSRVSPSSSARGRRISRLVMALRQDLRYGLRQLVRAPGFTIAAILALALGVGATAATFSVVDAVLLKPLGYADADRLVVVMHDRIGPVSPRNFLVWSPLADEVFAGMEAAEWWTPNLSGQGDPEKLTGLHVTPGMFRLLGVAPELGRTLDVADADAREVVISHGLWVRRFGADETLLGRDIRLDAEVFTVVGVMPETFRFAPFWATGAELWAPLPLASRAGSGGQSLRVFARLADGTSLAAARDRVAALTAELERRDPGTNRNVTVTPLKEMVVGDVRPSILVVFAAVGFVLLVACANVAHMLLVRATAREREIAVRAALGAGRGRLVRQFLTESLLLSGAGAAAGALLAGATLGTLRLLAGQQVPRVDTMALDQRVLWFVAGVAVITGLAFGLAPIARLFRTDLTGTLAQDGRTTSSGRRGLRMRGLLMASEVAMAATLLVGAGLTLRSFVGLQAVDPGWDPDPVLTMIVSVAGTAESPEGRRVTFYQDLLDAVRALPEVEGASAINHAPLAGDVWTFPFEVEGRPAPPAGDEPTAAFRVVFADYFDTMGLRLVKGRALDRRDTLTSLPVVAVSEQLAARHWPGEDPIGKRLAFPDTGWLTVVGVVENAFAYDWAAPPASEAYLPFLQNAWYRENPAPHTAYMTLVARAKGDPASLEPALRAAVRTLAPDVTVSAVQPMRDVVKGSTSAARFLMSLLGAFAGTALVLAALGVYGVTAYDVAGRRREIGIRLAMGASPRQVLRQVLARGLMLVALGLAAGLAAASTLSQLLAGLLYGVEPTDPLVFIAAPATLAVCAIGATALPCWRATKLNPAEVLGR